MPTEHASSSSSSCGKYQNLDLTAIPLVAPESDSNMHRNFSLRRNRSQPRVPSFKEPAATEAKRGNADENRTIRRSLSTRLLRRVHSRSHGLLSGEKQDKKDTANALAVLGENAVSTIPRRTLSRTDRLVKVIANPDSLFVRDPASPPAESRFNPNPKSVILRTFFSPNLDLAPTYPLVYAASQRAPPSPPSSTPSSLEMDAHIFDSSLLPNHVLADMPPGHVMRPLVRGDFGRGFLEVLRVTGKVGYVSQKRWDERCEWLRRRAETGDEYVLVVLDVEQDKIVGVGRWTGEKGFMNNLATNGRIEDIAVARDQKGKKMGLRILEALVHLSSGAGCLKTVVNCSEANEAFHAQCGFVRDGCAMVVHHGSGNGKSGENTFHS